MLFPGSIKPLAPPTLNHGGNQMSVIYDGPRPRASVRPTKTRPSPETPFLERRARRYRSRTYLPDQQRAFDEHVKAIHKVAPPYRGTPEDIALLVAHHYPALDGRACSVFESTFRILVKCSGT
jgi:hypothetical protein